MAVTPSLAANIDDELSVDKYGTLRITPPPVESVTISPQATYVLLRKMDKRIQALEARCAALEAKLNAKRPTTVAKRPVAKRKK